MEPRLIRKILLRMHPYMAVSPQHLIRLVVNVKTLISVISLSSPCVLPLSVCRYTYLYTTIPPDYII